MRLMLVNPNRAQAVDTMREVGLLQVVLPDLAVANQPGVITVTGRPADQAWLETLEVLQLVQAPSFPLALAALVHAFVDAKGCMEVGRTWKLSNLEIARASWLVANHDALIGARRSPWPKLQRLLISDGIDELLALREAIARAGGRATDDVDYCRELLKLPPDELDPPPLLTGDDLIRHGVPRGREYQRLLTAVRDAQLEKKITTKDEAIALVDELRAGKRDTRPAED
jgi:poly(A) polymerase